MNTIKVFICSILVLVSNHLLASETEALIKVPLRIYMVTTPDYGPLNVEKDVSIKHTLETVNLIWRQANIEFYIANSEQYEPKNIEQYKRVISSSESSQKDRVRALRGVCPKPKAIRFGIDICVVANSFSSKHGGVAFNFPKKYSSMVIWPLFSGGKKIQNPATLAHEIGHTLGLKHAGQNDIFLMRGAGNNIRRVGRYDEIKLSKDEIKKARSVANKIAEPR